MLMTKTSEARMVEGFTRLDVAYDQALTGSVMLPVSLSETHPELHSKLHSAVEQLQELVEELKALAFPQD